MSEQPDEMVDVYLRHLLQGGQAPDLAGMDARERAVIGTDANKRGPYRARRNSK